MQVIEYKSAAEFLRATRHILMKNEAANAVMLGYAENQVSGIESAMSTNFYAVVDNDAPVLPAMFTPEVWPLLTDGPEEAVRIFARFFYPKNPQPTGVIGPKDASLAFADEWERLTRCNLEIHHNLRLYTCTAVANVDLAAGSARQATLADFDLVKEWRIAFRDDVDAPLGTRDADITRNIDEGRYFLWETDHPVSMALLARETGNTGMIGAVYTPPERRNHGYATAITAAVTQAILDSGKKYATLYTNLDNPTSNSIYQQIGYKPIIDSTLWKFSPAI